MLEGEVHLWTQSLAAGAEAFEEYLSEDERGRADRFRFGDHRRHFVVARGRLREIIASYLHQRPEQIAFTYGAKGKPEVGGLKFNLSHSGELAVFAFATDRELGIDVELVRPEIAREQIAERFFAPREIQYIRSQPPEQQAFGFFHCWTRKEAYIKAVGHGLSIPLSSFDSSADRIGKWSIRSLEMPEGYAGALAVEGGDYAVILR